MLNIRIIIRSYLKTLHSRVYFQDAPDTATYPYIVYDFVPITDSGEERSDLILEIDGWDNKDDTTVLETLMNTINQINKSVLSDDNISIVCFLDTKLPMTDTNPIINRRKYTYTCTIHGEE